MHPLGANRAYAFLGQLAAGREPSSTDPESRESGERQAAAVATSLKRRAIARRARSIGAGSAT